jgi:hypothetical protein
VVYLTVAWGHCEIHQATVDFTASAPVIFLTAFTRYNHQFEAWKFVEVQSPTWGKLKGEALFSTIMFVFSHPL